MQQELSRLTSQVLQEGALSHDPLIYVKTLQGDFRTGSDHGFLDPMRSSVVLASAAKFNAECQRRTDWYRGG
jgi:hypothetical protein